MNTIPAKGSQPSVDLSWTRRYVGRPWSSGGYGPESFDCWGLVHAVYLYRLGTELPRHPGVYEIGRDTVAGLIREHATGGRWLAVDKPSDLCIVAMGRRFVDHVGIYVAAQGGLVLHSGSSFGVVLQPLSVVRSHFSTVRYYELD